LDDLATLNKPKARPTKLKHLKFLQLEQYGTYKNETYTVLIGFV
jgi:hypothetical protein